MNQSYFGEIVFAGIGGILLVIGLLMEHFGDRSWYEYKCLPEKRSESLKWFGEWFVIIGVGIEIVVACFTASKEWNNDPLNQSINSISATLRLKVSGAHSEMFKFPVLGVFEQSDPDMGLPSGTGEMIFLEGTNTTKSIYTLTCVPEDVGGLGSGVVGASNDWRGLIVKFHEGGNFSEIGDMRGSFASNNFVNGTHVGMFNKVGGIVINLSQLATNLYVESGIVEVRVNSSRWQFPIPRQRPKRGFITSKFEINKENNTDAYVLPIILQDWVVPTRFPAETYDGK